MDKNVTISKDLCKLNDVTLSIRCVSDDLYKTKHKIEAADKIISDIFDKYLNNEDKDNIVPLYHVYNRPRVLFLQNLLSEYGVPCLVFYVNKKSVIWFDEVKDADRMKKVRKILKICNIGLRKTNFKDSDHKSYHAYECYYIDKEK